MSSMILWRDAESGLLTAAEPSSLCTHSRSQFTLVATAGNASESGSVDLFGIGNSLALTEAPILQFRPTVMLPSYFRTGTDDRGVFNRPVPLAMLLARPAQSYSLIQSHVVADDGGLADDNPKPVID